jgi:hypothetical protein
MRATVGAEWNSGPPCPKLTKASRRSRSSDQVPAPPPSVLRFLSQSTSALRSRTDTVEPASEFRMASTRRCRTFLTASQVLCARSDVVQQTAVVLCAGTASDSLANAVSTRSETLSPSTRRAFRFSLRPRRGVLPVDGEREHPPVIGRVGIGDTRIRATQQVGAVVQGVARRTPPSGDVERRRRRAGELPFDDADDAHGGV